MSDVLNSFTNIEVEKPVDKIIKQIKLLISSGQLKPGDRLPSERQLVERLGLGRTYIRDAIRKLEFYGILKTHPQSGTRVAGIGINALEGLISNVLQIEESDFSSLVETRVILEIEGAKLAALRRTHGDLDEISMALQSFHEIVTQGEAGIDEDFMFHLKITEATKNKVIKSLLMIVVPEIMEIYKDLRVCEDGKSYKSYNEHMDIFNAIKNQQTIEAGEAMRYHLQEILEYSKKERNNNIS